MKSLTAILTEAHVKNATEKSPTGATFYHIQGYKTKMGKVTNVKLNVGFSYENAKKKDIETLKNLDVRTLNSSLGVQLLEEARKSLLGSLIAPNKVQSEAQKNAYTHLTNGVKIHNESGEVYIYALLISEKVLVEGEKKTTNKRELTIAKDLIRKQLRTGQFRQYTINPEQVEKLSGGTETIEFVMV